MEAVGYRFVLLLAWGWITLESHDRYRVPIFTFHSVSSGDLWLQNKTLTFPLESFDLMMEWLSRMRYKTAFFDELHQLRKSGNRPGRLVMISFDDGYLDNWVGVLHVLEKYHVKGTVFVSTDWLHPADECRPRLPYATGDELEWKGYLSKPELIALQKSGLVDIQSHACTHDKVFISDSIEEFVTPRRMPLWLYWLLNPSKKGTWFKNSCKVPFGYPIFKTGEALEAPRFIPDNDLIEALCQQASTEAFFDSSNWHDELLDTLREWKSSKGSLGRFETHQELQGRWSHELSDSRTMLEETLNKPVRHLAWPRSVYAEKCEEMALKLGYLSTTARNGRYNGSYDCHRLERVHLSSSGRPWLDTVRFLMEIWVFRGHYVFWPFLWLVQRLSAGGLKKNRKK